MLTLTQVSLATTACGRDRSIPLDVGATTTVPFAGSRVTSHRSFDDQAHEQAGIIRSNRRDNNTPFTKKTGASKVTALLVLSHDAPPCFFSNRNRDPANCPVISKQVRPPGQWHQAPVDLSSRSVAFPARKVNLTQSVTADANKERQSP
jgi:hypothetical protein